MKEFGRPVVLVPEPIALAGLELLRTHCVCVAPWENAYRGRRGADEVAQEIWAAAEEAQGIVVRLWTLSEAELSRLPNLLVIGKHGVGVDNIACDIAARRGIIVFNTPESVTNAVAEHTIGLIIAMVRHIHEANIAMSDGARENAIDRSAFVGTELRGRTLGVIGFGRIGRRVAEIASAGFGMQVRAYDPFAAIEHENVTVAADPFLSELLAVADVITCHLPLNPGTYHLIGEDELALTRPGCWLINCSRGGIIDEIALAQALATGQIAGAALDVFESEPLPPYHPLRKSPNVLMTPHIASLTREAMERTSLEVAAGMLTALTGGTPHHVVQRANSQR